MGISSTHRFTQGDITMRLKSFQVRLFRNVIDSGPITVEDVTCLVGKNEAGKSALLQALHHLNPAKPQVNLDLLDEYPRWLKKEHEISGAIQHAIPITATFELTDDEVQRFATLFGKDVITSKEVIAHRSYAEPSKLQLDVSIDYQIFVDNFIAGLSKGLQASIGKVSNTTELIKRLENLQTGPAAPDSTESEGTAADAVAALLKLHQTLSGHPNLRGWVDAEVETLLPRTFYFSSYSQLDGRYHLNEVFSAVTIPSNDESLQAAADFLQLARVVPQTVENWDFEASNAELEAISSVLTKRVKDHWKQNDHLRLKVSLESQQVPAANGQHIDRYLQFRVEDTRHDFSSRLDRRSTGFRWFVSFLASFLEFEKDQNLILLLDEPGLSLHARAQMDLLDTIEGKLANKRQVIYSTHSPFMVKTNRLDRIRITEDQGPEDGSVVLNDAGIVSDPDTLFPLQAALGYDVVQSLFIGNQNVLLEGISDFIYITAISDLLVSRKRGGVIPSARLLPAGGAGNIPTFIALLGGKLDIVVVLDGSTDRQRIDATITKGRLDQARVLVLETFCNVKRADIEDLFEPAEYLNLYNASLGRSLKLGDLLGNDRIVNRIARADGEFNHGVVAAHFLKDLESNLNVLSEATLDRFEALINAINTALPTA